MKAESPEAHNSIRSQADAEDLSKTAGFVPHGAIWHLPDGPKQRARDAAIVLELEGKYLSRSGNLYGAPQTVLEVYGYNVEAHAEEALAQFANGDRVVYPGTGIDSSLEEKVYGMVYEAACEPTTFKTLTICCNLLSNTR